MANGAISIQQGEVAIAPQFDYAADFSEGLAAVQQDGRYGYIDTDGNWVVEPTYTNAGRFSEGFARVQMENQ